MPYQPSDVLDPADYATDELYRRAVEVYDAPPLNPLDFDDEAAYRDALMAQRDRRQFVRSTPGRTGLWPPMTRYA